MNDEALRALENEVADVLAADLRAHPMKIETTNQRAERLAKRVAEMCSALLSSRQEVAPVAWEYTYYDEGIDPGSSIRQVDLSPCRFLESWQASKRDCIERPLIYGDTGQTSDARDALLRIREAVTQEDESAFGYRQVSHGSGIPRAYSVRDSILCTIDRELGINGRTRMDEAVMLVRDVCEMDPADPDAPDTVCIRVSDLTRIAERYTHAAMRQEGGE